jgi:hypothetical protein
MKQGCLVVVILLLGNIAAVPAERRVLVGSMVGYYGVEITESKDQRNPNFVNLTLSLWVEGVNTESCYYNCGMSEKLTIAKCEIPDQGTEVIQHVDRALMYSVRVSGEYDRKLGKWYIFSDTFEVVFLITLQSPDTQVDFSLETETGFINYSTLSNEVSTANESVSFDYEVKTKYLSNLNPDIMTAGVYFSGLGISIVIIAMTARKIIPEETVSNKIYN